MQEEAKCQFSSADCRERGGAACFPQSSEGSLVSVQMVTGTGEGTPGYWLVFDECFEQLLLLRVREGVKIFKKFLGNLCTLHMPIAYYKILWRHHASFRG